MLHPYRPVRSILPTSQSARALSLEPRASPLRGSNNNFSKINLVDLAGSERASRTGAEGSTLPGAPREVETGAAPGPTLQALGEERRRL